MAILPKEIPADLKSPLERPIDAGSLDARMSRQIHAQDRMDALLTIKMREARKPKRSNIGLRLAIGFTAFAAAVGGTEFLVIPAFNAENPQHTLPARSHEATPSFSPGEGIDSNLVNSDQNK